MYRRSISLLLACMAGPAMAQTATPVPPELAAEQVMHDFNTGGIVLGQSGNADFKFAQTFELQAEGAISHLMLPINCSTATTVRVTVQPTLRSGFPSGAVAMQQDVPAPVLDSWTAANGMQSLRMVEFARPRTFRPGRYAFTVEAIGGECMLWTGPAGDTYAGGEAFVINGVSLTSWYAMGRDLAFQVFQRPL